MLVSGVHSTWNGIFENQSQFLTVIDPKQTSIVLVKIEADFMGLKNNYEGVNFILLYFQNTVIEISGASALPYLRLLTYPHYCVLLAF